MATYTVMQRDLEELTKKINHITKKCDKAGISYTYSVSEPYEHIIRKRDSVVPSLIKVYSFALVDVELEVYFRYNGWTVLGSVSRKDGIVQCYFKDAELIRKYKDTDFHCDHCQKRARRNSVVVLENEAGEQKLVGTSCLKEFTRGLDGNLIAAFVDVKDHLDELVLRANPLVREDEDEVEEDGGLFNDSFCSYYGKPQYDARDIVAAASYVIRSDGEYVPAGSNYATWKEVYDFYGSREVRNDSASQEEARKAIEWVKGLSEEEITKSSYMFNLRQILDVGYCAYRHFGLLVSLIPVYQKHLIREAMKETMSKPSEYVGEVGDKLSLNVILLKSISYESMYGTGYFHLFADENGNVFKWSTNKGLWVGDYGSIENGTKLSLTGTVKSHDEYKGTKQTIITRCKWSVIKEEEEHEEGTWDDSVLENLGA